MKKTLPLIAVLLLAACGSHPDYMRRGDDPDKFSDETLCFYAAQGQVSDAVRHELVERDLDCADLLKSPEESPYPVPEPDWRDKTERMNRDAVEAARVPNP